MRHQSKGFSRDHVSGNIFVVHSSVARSEPPIPSQRTGNQSITTACLVPLKLTVDTADGCDNDHYATLLITSVIKIWLAFSELNLTTAIALPTINL
jgi:hypothetical protein